jgi:purine-binding chemotaxis protein CheW
VTVADTQQYSTFEIDGQLYGVEVESVQEVIRFQPMTPVPQAPPSVVGLINLRGQVTTAIDLRLRLELAPRAAEDIPMIVVVRTDDGLVSLLVDRIGDVLDTHPDTFEPAPETLTGTARELIRGAFKLGERLLLALDVDRTVDVQVRRLGTTAPEADSTKTNRRAVKRRPTTAAN